MRFRSKGTLSNYVNDLCKHPFKNPHWKKKKKKGKLTLLKTLFINKNITLPS